MSGNKILSKTKWIKCKDNTEINYSINITIPITTEIGAPLGTIIFETTSGIGAWLETHRPNIQSNDPIENVGSIDLFLGENNTIISVPK